MIARLLAAAALVVGGLALAGPALATQTSPNIGVPSQCHSGWYVNPDEEDRQPSAQAGGFAFVGNDLMHRPTSFDLKYLHPGSFHASPTPSLNSFFSVEVRDSTTGGYGTLRWNTSTHVWDLVTNLGSFSHAHPVDFIGTDTKWGKLTANTKVVSFGVGYVNSPNNGTDTVVSKVYFGGHTYDLTCQHPEGTPCASQSTSTTLPQVVAKGDQRAFKAHKPKPCPSTSSPSPSPSTSTSASATPSHSTSPSPSHSVVGGNTGDKGDSGALPVTGSSTNIVGGVAVGIVIIGGGLFWAARRRKTRFEA